MEEGQRQRQACIIGSSHGCLNPCCNGRGSKTSGHGKSFTKYKVLILVVMEEGQRLLTVTFRTSTLRRLNPCCNGRGSKTTQKKFALKVVRS